MTQPAAQSIIPGLSLDSSGQATVDAALGERLIELAIAMETHTAHRVDVQHVLAAIIIAARQGELSGDEPLAGTDDQLCNKLAGHVNALFERFGGRVSRDE